MSSTCCIRNGSHSNSCYLIIDALSSLLHNKKNFLVLWVHSSCAATATHDECTVVEALQTWFHEFYKCSISLVLHLSSINGHMQRVSIAFLTWIAICIIS